MDDNNPKKKSKKNEKNFHFVSTSKNLQKSFSFFLADVTPYLNFYISCSFFCFEQTRVSCNQDSTLKKSLKIARFEVDPGPLNKKTQKDIEQVPNSCRLTKFTNRPFFMKNLV